MYRFEADPAGILLVETSGFWTVPEAEAYLAALRGHVAASRRERGYALVLVDGREAEIQPAEVMARMGEIETVLVEGPRDRAAYVVTNSLAKMQAQRLATTDGLKVFLSPSAARTWLLAYEGASAR